MEEVHVTHSAAELIVMTASHFRSGDMFFGSSSASRVTSCFSNVLLSSTLTGLASVSFLSLKLGAIVVSSLSGEKLFDVEFRPDITVLPIF
jgi:hypothetical protein